MQEDHRATQSARMPVALVVQRFGSDIIGGAESHARLIAEHLQRDAGYAVEVYTSTSRDYRTWDDAYPEGTHVEGELTVHRFRPAAQRGMAFTLVNALAKACHGRLPPPLRDRLESLWIRAQGPYVPALIGMLERRQEQYAAVIFFTYLYYPTVVGLTRIKRPTILVPTAHDERPFSMQTVRQAMAQADWIFANTAAEAQLIQRVHKISPAKMQVVGVGLTPPQAIRVPELAPDRPIRLLYLGRVGPAKGVDELISYSQSALARGLAVPCTLRIAGPLEGTYRVPADESRIQYLGVLSEERKADELRWADIVVNPSHHESLSLLVLEGILAKKILLVQTASAVLQDYTQRYPTVLGYRTAQDWCHAVLQARQLMQSPTRLADHLEAAAAEIQHAYSWDRVIAPFRTVIATGGVSC